MFEDMRYETWKEQVEQVLPSLLKRNLLMKPAASSLSHLPSTPLPGADEAGDELGKFLKASYAHTCLELHDGT